MENNSTFSQHLASRKWLYIGAGSVLCFATAFFLKADNRQGTGNSPVKIVGGSLKFHATGDWAPYLSVTTNCGKNYPCIISNAKVDTTQMVFEGTQLQNLYSWVIVINTYNQAGTVPGDAVVVYPSKDSIGTCSNDGTAVTPTQSYPLCIASSSTSYVTAYLTTKTNHLIPDFIPDPNRRFRYHFDSCCNSNQPDYRDTINQISLYFNLVPASSATPQGTTASIGTFFGADEVEIGQPQ